MKQRMRTLLAGSALLAVLLLTGAVLAPSTDALAPPGCGQSRDGTFDDGAETCTGPHTDCTEITVCEPG